MNIGKLSKRRKTIVESIKEKVVSGTNNTNVFAKYFRADEATKVQGYVEDCPDSGLALQIALDFLIANQRRGTMILALYNFDRRWNQIWLPQLKNGYSKDLPIKIHRELIRYAYPRSWHMKLRARFWDWVDNCCHNNQ